MADFTETNGAGRPGSVSPFCWACGAFAAAPGEAPCTACGVQRAAPNWDATSMIGRDVEYRVRLSNHYGIVVGASGTTVVVLDAGTETIVPLDRVRVIVPTDVASGWYRLFVKGLGDRFGSPTLADRRAFAASAVAAGNVDAVNASGLGPREICWLRMWCHHQRRDASAALAEAVALGALGYPDRVGVFAAAIDQWITDDAVRGLVFGLCSEQPDQALSKLLFAALAAPPPPLDHLPLDPATLGAPGVGSSADTVTLARRLAAHDVVGVAASSRYASDLAVRSMAVLRACPGLHLPSLRDVDMALIDDAIDAGAVTATHVDEIASTLGEGPRRYLTARVAPERLSDDELRSLGHASELRRRAFMDRRELADSTSDAGDDAVRRYELLSRLRSGDHRVIGDLVPLLPPDQSTVAIAVGASLHRGIPQPDALRDPSTWGPLVDVFTRCIRDEPTALDAAARNAAGWSLLDLAKRELFSWRFTHAVAAASYCAQVVDDEPRTDEATAIKAAAALMDGRRDLASTYLVVAAEGAASDSLLVNLALVQSAANPEAAASALMRLAAQTGHRELRARAAVRAARLMSAQDDEWRPSASHREWLRSACVADLPIAEHADAIGVLGAVDSDWVGDERNTAAYPGAASVEHRLAVARVAGFDPVLDVIQAAYASVPPDDAAARELEKLVQMVFDAMSGSTDPVPGAGALGLEMFDRNLPVAGVRGVALRCFCLRELAWAAMAEDPPWRPDDDWQRHLSAALADIHRLEPGDQADARTLVDEARATIAHAWLRSWAHTHDDLIDSCTSINEAFEEQTAAASRPAERHQLAEVWQSCIKDVADEVATLGRDASAHQSAIPHVDTLHDDYQTLLETIRSTERTLREML